MEQTNLIVTADGKTWEELSRDRSHCGPKTFASCTRDSGNLGVNEDVVFNMWRGDGGNNGAAYTGGGHLGIKNFAVRGDKYLKPTEDGLYQLNFYAQTQSSNVDGICYVQVNEATVLVVTQSTESNGRSVGLFPSMTVRLNRGDELNWHWGGADMYGGNGGYIHASLFKIGE